MDHPNTHDDQRFDVNTQIGMTSRVYLVTTSMQDADIYSADSELLGAPQSGQLRFVTELGVIDLVPQEIAIIPQGLPYRFRLLYGPARGCCYHKTQRTGPKFRR